jgi:short-subunit dehydrogenase
MARAGVEVALVARREGELCTLADEIEGLGGRARVYPLDVTDTVATAETIVRADEELGGLDLVVANAGVSRLKWSGKLTWEDCEPVVQVNVVGFAATVTAILPRFAQRRAGHIVGLSSLAQYRGLPRAAAYCGSKAFVSTFLESLRVDLRLVGVNITDVRPGYVRTDLTAGAKAPLPMVVEAPAAAATIWRGIQKRQKVVEFPWPLAAALRWAQLVPNGLYEPAAGRIFR